MPCLNLSRCNCELGIDPDTFFFSLKYLNLSPDTNVVFESILCDNCFLKFFFNCKIACHEAWIDDGGPIYLF